VETVPFDMAAAVLRRHHYSGSTANTAVARHGLRRVDEMAIRGAALWMPPLPPAARSVAGEGWRGVLCLSRLAVETDVPANGTSFLLGRSMRLLDRARWPVLLTYADTAHGHTGAIYLATNWRCLGEVPAGDVWVGPDGQRGRRRGPRVLTADEMRAAGYRRVKAAPKIKFVHP